MEKHTNATHDIYVLSKIRMPERYSNKIPQKAERLFFRAKKDKHYFKNPLSRLLQWKLYPHKNCFIVRTPIFQFEHNQGQCIIGGYDNFISWNPWAFRTIRKAKKDDRWCRRVERKYGC